MAGFTNYTENKLLDHALGGPDFTRPATVYMALYTTAPDAEAGTGGVELSGSNYSRVAVTNNSTNFPSASGGAKSNGAVITFPTPSGSWGTVVAFAVLDASTAGNMIASNTLVSSKAINSGDTVSFAIGDLSFTLD